MFGNAVIRHQIRQIQNLNVWENPRGTAGCGNVDINRSVCHTAKAFCAIRAKLRTDEQLNGNRTVRRGFDIVLEDDQTVIVLVVFVGVGRGTNVDIRSRPKNLSMDLKQKCMLEKLPDGGFVRHMEIVYCQPGRVFRMNGGLGPLQSMGVAGSLTVSFKEVEGKTKVTLVYLVSGSSLLKLDQIAAPVNQVLTGQMRRFEKHAASLTAKAELKQ